MIKSMTGFGRAEVEEDGKQVTVEIRSVNNRFCNVSVRMPKPLVQLETKLIEAVQSRLTRGQVNVSVAWKEPETERQFISLDIALATAYRDKLTELREKLGLEGVVSITTLAAFPGVLRFENLELENDSLIPLVEKTTLIALDELDAMRTAEGKQLYLDFVKRIELIDSVIKNIEELAPLRVNMVRERLNEKIAQILTNGEVDQSRLVMEVAIVAERYDVTEECVRFQSHIRQFKAALEEDIAVGRKLNFLLQEMGREANTIGAKASDAAIAHLIVQIKEELEKLREQVQNVE